MNMMFAMHDALRRELAHVGRISGLRGGNPGALLHAALGWELSKKFLLVHHQSENDTLWPALRDAGQSDRVALADALEAEHAVIEPLVTAIDAADPACGYQRFGDIIDELVTKLTTHLAHEESDRLPLTDASLTPREWQHFAQVHTERICGDAPMYMPWALNGASPQTLGAVLSKVPRRCSPPSARSGAQVRRFEHLECRRRAGRPRRRKGLRTISPHDATDTAPRPRRSPRYASSPPAWAVSLMRPDLGRGQVGRRKDSDERVHRYPYPERPA